MYRLFLGKIPTLCNTPLPETLLQQAPEGQRRQTWLAGRALLHHAVSPLPEVVLDAQGKPAFCGDTDLWFNLSHSGDSVALLLSDEGPVGCDIEVLRPRPHWQTLANAVFTQNEHDQLDLLAEDERLTAFWRIWTRKEAMVKQRGGSAWQIVSFDSTQPLHLYLSDIQTAGVSLAVCTPTPFSLSSSSMERVG